MRCEHTDELPRVRQAIENLGRLAELFFERREQLAREIGLTVPQWHILEEIAGQNFMPSMFARERESSPAAVSRILRQVQDRGLVTVSISATDGRQRRYELTERGARVLERLRGFRQRAIEAVWLDLDPAEVSRFSRFSADLIERLEVYARGKETDDGKDTLRKSV